MSFLDWPREPSRPNRVSNRLRQRVATELITVFSVAFPTVTYSLIWDSMLINAQAWRLGMTRNVFLYGGLVRHPLIKRAGLALALAHETGHHLGGEPRDVDLKWMTWQGQADYWAARVGMPAVFGADAPTLTLQGARQIGLLERQLSANPDAIISDLPHAIRLQIYTAALHGEELPACAKEAYRLEYNRLLGG
jgi:hypothetical protein